MKHIIHLLLFTLAAISMRAQRVNDSTLLHRLVVCDIETKVPIRSAIVSTQTGYRDTTDWRGVCFVPKKIDTLTISKHNYIPERLVQAELSDSTFLIPEGKGIGQVTVWGKRPIKDYFNPKERYYPQPSQFGGIGITIPFDLGNIIDRRGRRDHKHLRITREKFKEMDNSGDPIVNAYNKAMEEAKARKELEDKDKSQGGDNNGNDNKDKQIMEGKQPDSTIDNITQERNIQKEKKQ